MTTYRLPATALCPALEGQRDYYDVEVESTTFIDALELRAFLDAFANERIYQEHIADRLTERFDVSDVKITGSHPPGVQVIT